MRWLPRDVLRETFAQTAPESPPARFLLLLPGLFLSLSPSLVSSIVCHKCEGLCPKECKVGTKTMDSTRAAKDLSGCTLIEGNLIINIRRGGECLGGGVLTRLSSRKS